VSNSYRHPATSTLVSAAWVTLGCDRYVRLAAVRVSSPRRPYGRGGRAAFELPERTVKILRCDVLVFGSLLSQPLDGQGGFLELAGFQPDADLMIVADWFQDRGADRTAASLRETAEGGR
jgi:hypothetical protein